MAEENKGTPTPEPGATPPAGPTPAIDQEAIKAAVREAMKEMGNGQDNDLDLPGSSTPTPAPRATENPLEAVMKPILESHLRPVTIAAASAQDAAVFYATHPEALPHRAEIEKAFNALVQQGTPFNREAVWDWYVGKKRREGVDVYANIEEQKVAQAQAAQGVDGGVKPQPGQIKDAFTATDDELKKAMEGVSF